MNRKNPKDTQNFITSKKHVKEILDRTNICKRDHVVEIGSGKGHFTKELVKMSRSVTAIEIDEDLCRNTQNAVYPFENIKVIHTDILKYTFPKSTNYKIFGSIPYNISTDIVKKLRLKVRQNIATLSLKKVLRKD